MPRAEHHPLARPRESTTKRPADEAGPDDGNVHAATLPLRRHLDRRIGEIDAILPADRLLCAQPSASPGTTSPDSYAATISCDRSLSPSFVRMRLTCVFAVNGLTTSAAAMSALDRPRATSRSTSTSRCVNS